MNSLRLKCDQIGGRNSISIWSWVITIPLSLFVSSDFLVTPSVEEFLIWTLIVLLVHAILGGVLWVGWKFLLPNIDRPSRPATAVCFYAFVGLSRGLLLQGAQENIGISGADFLERMAINILGSVTVLALIAIVVDDFRTDAQIVERLGAANETLSALLNQEEAALRAADVDVIERVHNRVEVELIAAGSDSNQVRMIAESIVRPLSHELAQTSADEQLFELPLVSKRESLTFSQAFALLEPPAPWAVAIIMEVTVFAAVLARFGPLVALVNLIVGGALITLGCWLIVKIFVPPVGALARLVTLIFALGIVGAFASAVTSMIVTELIAPFTVHVLGATVGVIGAGVGVSTWSAVNTGRQARLNDMTQAVASEALALERVRGLINHRRVQASRFLHGPIQGELLAAAFRGDSPDLVRASVARQFARYGEEAADQFAAREQIDNLLFAWTSVLEITQSTKEDVWPLLDGSPVCTELLVDTLSEALTNAVRHASSNRVEVQIFGHQSFIELVVRSTGPAGSEGKNGIGLDQLRARGAAIELKAAGDQMVLTARLQI